MAGSLLLAGNVVAQESYSVQLHSKTKLALLPFQGCTLGVWACLREDESIYGFTNT